MTKRCPGACKICGKPAHKKPPSSGLSRGKPPYGYQNAGRGMPLAINQPEQEIIGLAKKLRSEGMTLKEISGALNILGYRTRSGANWNIQYVSRILSVPSRTLPITDTQELP